MTITKERLQKLIRAIDSESYDEEEIVGWVNSDEILELARIALAALTTEPVAYMYKDKLHTDPRFSLHTRFSNWSQEDINEYEITEIPLYAAPPAPVVPDGYALVPVEPTAEMIEATFAGEMELQSVQHQIRNRERRAQYYRAMLAAAPQQGVKEKL